MKTEEILQFLHEAEKLKKELRHSWLSDGRQESVAEHAWRLSLMAILMAPNLEEKIDLFKALKIAVIHDISEVFVGDVPAFSNSRENHRLLEKESMENFKNKYNSAVVDEVYNLWKEYEEEKTLEAKFIKALDKLEVRIQHNEANMDTWSDIEYPRSQFIPDKYCQYDNFLKEFNELVKKEAREKIIKESDRDINEVMKDVKKIK